jgi:hypothetical protein
MLILALYIIVEIGKNSKCPSTDKWISKTWFVNKTECCPAILKNEGLVYEMTWITLETTPGTGLEAR